VLVSPEVCERARECLPERDPYAYLRTRETKNVADYTHERVSFTALVVHTLGRLVETARTAAIAVAGVIVLVLLAEFFH
jgi:hypothetical protein